MERILIIGCLIIASTAIGRASEEQQSWLKLEAQRGNDTLDEE